MLNSLIFDKTDIIRLFDSTHVFVNILNKETIEVIESDYFLPIFSDDRENEKKFLALIDDYNNAEQLIIIALMAKKAIEQNQFSYLEVISSFFRINRHFSKVIKHFNVITKNFKVNFIRRHPKYEKNIIKNYIVEFFINYYLFIALTLFEEEEIENSSKFYKFLSFIIKETYHIFYSYYNDYNTLVKKISEVLGTYIGYDVIIHFLDHFPEQYKQLFFIIKNAKSVSLTDKEISIVIDYINASIFIEKEEQEKLITKLKQIKK